MYLLQESLVQCVSSRQRESLAAENLHDLQLLSPHVVVSAVDRLLLKNLIDCPDIRKIRDLFTVFIRFQYWTMHFVRRVQSKSTYPILLGTDCIFAYKLGIRNVCGIWGSKIRFVLLPSYLPFNLYALPISSYLTHLSESHWGVNIRLSQTPEFLQPAILVDCHNIHWMLHTN